MSADTHQVIPVSPKSGGAEGGGDAVKKVLEKMDNASFSLYHVKIIIISGMGFFTDSYDLFCISLLTKLIGRVYYQDNPFYYNGIVNPGKLPINVDVSISAVALCGTLGGQLFFGAIGDLCGRKSAFGITLAIMIFCAVAQVRDISGLFQFVYMNTFLMISPCRLGLTLIAWSELCASGDSCSGLELVVTTLCPPPSCQNTLPESLEVPSLHLCSLCKALEF